MKINGRQITDDDIVIDVQKAVDAFDRFKQVRTSGFVGDEASEGEPAYAFDRLIRSRLQGFRASFRPAGMLLASKQTFSKWKLDPPREPVKKKRSVLLAVLSITGIDISAQSILARNPINLGPMTELAALRSRKVTNDPEEVEDVIYEVELGELIFKAAELTVMSDWVVKEDGTITKAEAQEIGIVTVGLKEADVQIDFGETEPIDVTRRVAPDTDPFIGRTDGCVILWSENRALWIFQPTGGSPMRVRAENVKLCKVKGRRGAFIDLRVMANEDQLFSDFRMRRQVTAKGKIEPSESTGLAGDQLEYARERLFSIMLAHRIEEAALLSFQRHKLP